MGLMVQIGAGNIGRGLIAPIFNQNGYETVFLDVNQDLINQLNEEESYQVAYQNSNKIKNVNRFSAESSINNQNKINKLFVDADYVSISVGINVLETIADTLTEAIRFMIKNNYEKKIKIIAFENANRATTQLKSYITQRLTANEINEMNEYISFYDSTIDGVIPNINDDSLSLISENYYEVIIEGDNEIDLDEVHLVEDLEPYIYRKLFIVNMGHATLAWYGHLKGYEDIVECAKDQKVINLFNQTTEETLKVLIGLYPNEKSDLIKYQKVIWKRLIENPLSDDVDRIGRNPRVKLHKEERFLKPARMYADMYQKSPVYLLKSMSYGFKYLIDLENLVIKDLSDLRSLIIEVTQLKNSPELLNDLIEECKNIIL